MIIKVSSGGGNLANYLLYGNKNSRDTSKITILDGNAKLTDKISKSMECKDKHFHFIISANGKRTDDDMQAIYEGFKKELLYSYSQEEVNMLAVLHQDTNNSHIHIQTPKRNLLTGTKLDLYFHKRDLNRFSTLTEYLNLRHKELSPSIPSKANPTKNWKYNLQAIQTKAEKQAFENMLLDKLYDNKDKFNSHDELMKYIQEDLKIKVLKSGYDYKKDNFYITINHDDKKKPQRVFSPLFNDGKSKYITNELGKKEYIKSKFSSTPLEKQLQYKKKNTLESLRAKLDKLQEIEKERIDKRLGRTKKLSTQRQNTLMNVIKKEPVPPSPKITPPPPLNNYEDLKKESKIEDDAQQYSLLKKLQKINLAEIAVNKYGFKFTKRNESSDIIKNTTTNKSLIIYIDENGYKYINPHNKKERGDIGSFLQKSAKVGMYRAMLDLINPLKAYLSIFKDLMKISELVLKLTLDTFLEKDFIENYELNLDKKPTRTRAPSIKGTDLKPF